MPRKAVVALTPKKRQGQPVPNRADAKVRFLAALASMPNVTAAAKAGGISRTIAYAWKRDDAEFAASWDSAIESAVDALEAHAWKRAARDSDTLAIFLLKAHRPERYREATRHEISGPNGTAIRIAYFDASLALTALTTGSESDR
jgi:hypothetical protein